MENEKILIDANRLKRRLERFEEFMVAFGNAEAAKATRAIINGLKIMPTVDAVEVVRCKDCAKTWCYLRQELGADGYCSGGEKKTNDCD